MLHKAIYIDITINEKEENMVMIITVVIIMDYWGSCFIFTKQKRMRERMKVYNKCKAIYI